MTVIKCRSAIVGLALAALLVATLAATGRPAAAAVRSAAASLCSTPVFYGLHGMGEGPSTTDPTVSPELVDFDKQNGISGAIAEKDVSYTTVTVSLLDLLGPPPAVVASEVAKLMNAVNNGESALQTKVSALASGCQPGQLKIALVGYSMGAWVINKWLKDHPAEWKWIKAVVFYGDPCWKGGADKGIIRAAVGDGIAGLVGCGPAKSYPNPAPHLGDTHPPIKSYCLGGDPVCGGGFGGNLTAMVPSAVACLLSNPKCPHLWYRVGSPGGVYLKAGAQFVVSQFAACTTPTITAVGPFRAISTQTVTITGSCFGTGNTSSAADTAYFRISDLTAGWNACSTRDSPPDQVTCNLSSWANGQITFSGFTGAYGQGSWVISPGDTLEIQVWNPQSGNGPATYNVVAGG